MKKKKKTAKKKMRTSTSAKRFAFHITPPKKSSSEHIGSTLDDLLEEDGTLSEVTAAAVKRVLAWQVAEEMKRQGITKAEMARRMKTSRASLERLIDPANASVTLRTIYRAASVLGKRISLELIDAA